MAGQQRAGIVRIFGWQTAVVSDFDEHSLARSDFGPGRHWPSSTSTVPELPLARIRSGIARCRQDPKPLSSTSGRAPGHERRLWCALNSFDDTRSRHNQDHPQDLEQRTSRVATFRLCACCPWGHESLRRSTKVRT